MKKLVFLICMVVFVASGCYAQRPAKFKNGIKTKLVQPDTLSTIQRDALTPKLGTLVYHKDTGISRWEEWDGSSWGGFGSVEVNDLSSAVTWANVPDANITGTSVTQHQASLSITESQISDLNHTTINNTLTSTSTDEALSAAQGKVLKDVQDTQQTSIDLNTAKTTFPGFTSLFADYAFTDNSTNWNTAFGWGDHSLSGYSTGAHTVDTDTQLPLIDDDTFATATATNVPSAESVKALVDANSGSNIYTADGITPDSSTRFLDLGANSNFYLRNSDYSNYIWLNSFNVELRNSQGGLRFRTGDEHGNIQSNSVGDVWTATSTVGDGHWAAPSGGDIEGISSSGTVAGSDVVLALGIYGDNDAGIQIDTDTNQIEVTANGGGSLISTGGDINLSGLNVNVKNLKVLDNDGVVLNNTANTFATTLINSEQTANYNLTIPVLTQNSTVALASDIPTLIDDDTFATATATNVASAESIKAYVDDLASKELLINSITASSRDFEVADTNGMNIIANTGNITLTVPDNIAMPLPIGSVIPLTRQKGSTGTVTIAYAAGVTGEAGFLYTDRDWGSLVKTAENTWILVSFPYTDLSAIGGGDVTKVGTPINNQFALWTGDGTVEGDAWFKADTVSDTAFRRIQIGLDDTVAGYLELFGHADNTANSGVSLYTNAGVGTEVQKYNIITDTISGDLLIQGTGGTGGGTYLVFDAATGAITAPNAEIADITSLGAKALMTSEAVDDRITPTTETGVALVLDNPLGKYYNMASANAGTTYTFSGQVVGGWAMCLINTTSEPVVTGATKIAGATWVTGTDMNLVVRHNGAATQYFFTKI